MSDKEPWRERWEPTDEQPRKGGQGESFLARSKENWQLAILKVLRNQKNDQARARMSKEVLNLRILHGAGCKVPEVLDGNTEQFQEKGVRLYFVMEHIDGDTLDIVVKTRGGLGLEVSIEIVRDLAGSTKIALDNDVIHRDLKPENIVVRTLEPPDAVIVDYGLSFNSSEDVGLTRASETLDNAFLSLPERRVPGGDRRDPRSDLTGLCGILFFCLTGMMPVDLRDSGDKPPHRRTGVALDRVITNPAQSQALDVFFDRGFAVAIENRFQTVEELSARLQGILIPGIQPVTENPVEVARRFSEQLLREDRKTQLAKYAETALSVVGTIQKTVNIFSGKLEDYELANAGFPSDLVRPPGTDLDRVIMFYARNRNHLSIGRAVAYDIRAEGSECVLYRATLRGAFKGTTKFDLVKDWNLILRYNGLGPCPSEELIQQDVTEAISDALRELQNDILHQDD